MKNEVKCLIALGLFVIFTYIGYRMLPQEEIVIKTSENVEQNKIYVHIEGCVHKPGIVEVSNGTRIFELIELAGGATDEADLTKINLANILDDEQKIYIPQKAIVDNNVESVSRQQSLSSVTLVNINNATLDELVTLNGIGEAMAKRILAYRETEGYFSSIEDIMNVEGIGEGKFNKIKDNIEI